VTSLVHEDEDAYRSAFRHLLAEHPDIRTEPSFPPSETQFKRILPAWPAAGKTLWLLYSMALAVGLRVGIWPRSLTRRVAGYDLIVNNGGSMLYDAPSVRTPVSVARLCAVLAPLYAGSRLGIPVVGLGTTVGPLDRRPARELVVRILRKFDDLEVRDDGSLALCQKLGIPAHRGPDVAFAMTPLTTERVADRLRSLPFDPSQSLCVCLRQHYTAGRDGDEGLASALAAATEVLVAEGLFSGVIVVPHTLGPTPVEDDTGISTFLMGRLTRVPAALVDDDFTPTELSALYGQTKAMVSVRLHGAILAIVAGTPALAIEYFTTKTLGAVQSADLAEFCLPFDAADAPTLEEFVRRLVGRLPAWKPPTDRLRSGLEATVGRWPTLTAGIVTVPGSGHNG
jgi:hypothetical protein